MEGSNGIITADGEKLRIDVNNSLLERNYIYSEVTGNPTLGGIFYIQDEVQLSFKNTICRGNSLYSSNINSLSYKTVSDESITTGGVCIFSKASTVINITDSTFNDNIGVQGGAISAFESSFYTIQSSVFYNNSAVVGAAIYISANVKIVVRDTIFSTNTADKGGAIFIEDQPEVEFVKCSFIANSAKVGGAIYSSFDNIAGIMVHVRDPLAIEKNVATQLNSGSFVYVEADAVPVNVVEVNSNIILSHNDVNNLITGGAINSCKGIEDSKPLASTACVSPSFCTDIKINSPGKSCSDGDCKLVATGCGCPIGWRKVSSTHCEGTLNKPSVTNAKVKAVDNKLKFNIMYGNNGCLSPEYFIITDGSTFTEKFVSKNTVGALCDRNPIIETHTSVNTYKWLPQEMSITVYYSQGALVVYSNFLVVPQKPIFEYTADVLYTLNKPSSTSKSSSWNAAVVVPDKGYNTTFKISNKASDIDLEWSWVQNDTFCISPMSGSILPGDYKDINFTITDTSALNVSNIDFFVLFRVKFAADSTQEKGADIFTVPISLAVWSDISFNNSFIQFKYPNSHALSSSFLGANFPTYLPLNNSNNKVFSDEMWVQLNTRSGIVIEARDIFNKLITKFNPEKGDNYLQLEIIRKSTVIKVINCRSAGVRFECIDFIDASKIQNGVAQFQLKYKSDITVNNIKITVWETFQSFNVKIKCESRLTELIDGTCKSCDSLCIANGGEAGCMQCLNGEISYTTAGYWRSNSTSILPLLCPYKVNKIFLFFIQLFACLSATYKCIIICFITISFFLVSNFFYLQSISELLLFYLYVCNKIYIGYLPSEFIW